MTPLLAVSHVGVGLADGVVDVIDETDVLLEMTDVVEAAIEDDVSMEDEETDMLLESVLDVVVATIEDEVEMMLDAVYDAESVVEEDKTVLLGCTEAVTR